MHSGGNVLAAATAAGRRWWWRRRIGRCAITWRCTRRYAVSVSAVAGGLALIALLAAAGGRNTAASGTVVDGIVHRLLDSFEAIPPDVPLVEHFAERLIGVDTDRLAGE